MTPPEGRSPTLSWSDIEFGQAFTVFHLIECHSKTSVTFNHGIMIEVKDRTILVQDLSCETEMYWWYLMIPEYCCAFHKSLQPRNELQPITLFSTCSTPSTANSAEVSGIPELQEVYGYVYFTQRIYLNNSVGSSNQNAQLEVSLGVHHDSWQWQWQWPLRWGWWRWRWRGWWSYEWHRHIRHLARVDLLEDYTMVPRPPSWKSISWHRCLHAPINPHHLQ